MDEDDDHVDDDDEDDDDKDDDDDDDKDDDDGDGDDGNDDDEVREKRKKVSDPAVAAATKVRFTRVLRK